MSASLIETEIDRISINLVSESYNYDKKNHIIRNKQFIERQWLEEYQELGVEELVNSLNHLYKNKIKTKTRWNCFKN